MAVAFVPRLCLTRKCISNESDVIYRLALAEAIGRLIPLPNADSAGD